MEEINIRKEKGTVKEKNGAKGRGTKGSLLKKMELCRTEFNCHTYNTSKNLASKIRDTDGNMGELFGLPRP
jgi:ribosomal protein S14